MIMFDGSKACLIYYLKSHLDMKYICTDRLNQNSRNIFFFKIEVLESLVRILEVIFRIEMIMLENPCILESKVNNEVEVFDKYIRP